VIASLPLREPANQHRKLHDHLLQLRNHLGRCHLLCRAAVYPAVYAAIHLSRARFAFYALDLRILLKTSKIVLIVLPGDIAGVCIQYQRVPFLSGQKLVGNAEGEECGLLNDHSAGLGE
jgi:hypothetical protein